jgi:hypothetical protein
MKKNTTLRQYFLILFFILGADYTRTADVAVLTATSTGTCTYLTCMPCLLVPYVILSNTHLISKACTPVRPITAALPDPSFSMPDPVSPNLSACACTILSPADAPPKLILAIPPLVTTGLTMIRIATLLHKTRPCITTYSDAPPTLIMHNPREQLAPLDCVIRPVRPLPCKTLPFALIPEGIIFGGFGGIVAGPALTMPSIVIGAGLSIAWIAEMLKHKIKNKHKAPKGGGGNNPNQDSNNKDKKKQEPTGPIDPKKHPNGEYENNPKHHPNSPDGIGKPPVDGQKGLDESIKVPGKEDIRVGIEGKKFVVFHQHVPGKWHGYIVEKFNDLRPAVQKALSKANLVNPKSGKIK